MKQTTILAILVLMASQAAVAQSRSSIRRGANSTEIVIHNTSPEAYKARREQAERAQAKLDAKRERARQHAAEERQRAHELKVVKLKHRQEQAQKVAKVEYEHHKKPSFFNGGQSTVFAGGFGPGFGFGFNPGFVGGYGYGNYGYRGYGYGFNNFGFRNAGFRRGFGRSHFRGRRGRGRCR